MELDELKQAWQRLDQRLDAQHTRDLQLLTEARLSRAQHGLRPLVVGQCAQIAAGVLIISWAASFWLAHWHTMHLAAYGLLIHGYGLLFTILGARTLYRVSQVDYAAPVLAIQKRLAELRAQRVRDGLWFAIAGCFIWIPMLLVVFYALGADIWAHDPNVIPWLLSTGAVCLALTLTFVHWARNPHGSRIAALFAQSSAGRSIARAQSALDEIAQFEKV